jgi:D-inositol-3-phosphate glycosyltransferase
MPVVGEQPRRVAMLSVHTSPLEQPGTGDAGGLNVYVTETARRMAERGTEVEIFTRTTSGDIPPAVRLAPGVVVRHLVAGPFEGLSKNDLPGQLCAFAAGLLRAEASHDAGWYDLVHSHYWLSGQVGWLAADRWAVPLVHTRHTMAKVKNAQLAEGDVAEPAARVIGEEQVVRAADRLLASTGAEARDLLDLYDADPERVAVVPPGVDLDAFRPGGPDGRRAARRRLGIDPDADMVLFVGRIQPLKGPDVLLRAAARMLAECPERRDRLVVAVLGGPSGSGLDRPEELHRLAGDLALDGVVRLHPPVARPALADWYRAADLVAVPSHSESFGLVALEAQACGTPVVAARVGGLQTAVRDGVTGLLIDGHSPQTWAAGLSGLLDAPGRRARMQAAAVRHAADFSWDATVDATLALYAEARSRSTRSRHAGLRRATGFAPRPVVQVGALAVAP